MDNSNKAIYFFAIFAGSIVGGYVPTLFGAGIFSLWDIVGSTLGAFIFLYLAYKFLV
ncbi:MAG: hypothetical protein M1429_01050 [Patescibacteria group bacterium]|nr:hypothetical protein [Patescibacteria group bacterium]